MGMLLGWGEVGDREGKGRYMCADYLGVGFFVRLVCIIIWFVPKRLLRASWRLVTMWAWLSRSSVFSLEFFSYVCCVSLQLVIGWE